MTVEIWRLNFLVFFFFKVILKQVYAANAACLTATTQAQCQNTSGCNGVWDSSSGLCYDCSVDQTTCQTNCLRRWINSSCVMKCTNAANSSDCSTCFGLWNAGASQCYDCMQDQSTCSDVCNRFWINGFCWDCNSSSSSCQNASTCNGTWNSGSSTCSVCWPNQQYCNGCNRFWDTSVSPQVCINCQLNQTTCENPSKCNGYWNSATSFCTVCSLNSANCQGSLCKGAWNGATGTCSNCNTDSRQCTLCNQKYLYGQCVNCNSGYNTCTSITYCNGEWDNVNAVCIICNESQTTCEATGAGNCNGVWQTTPAPARCNKCQNSLTECTKCGLNWIPGVPKCLNCNQDQTTCENVAICNGVWNSSTNTCLICNLDSGTCSSCPQLRNWDPSSPSSNTCLNCFTNQTQCTKCQYFWVPNTTYFDPSVKNTCINCDQSQDYCTNKLKCNGYWDPANSVCSKQCNLSSTQCSNCSGSWDSTNNLCNVCDKTQAECTLCGKQWVLGLCINCQLNQATCESSNCSGIWSTSSTPKCLVCNENSTNCKKCGGFWIDSQCLKCDTNSVICTKCGGVYNTLTNTCTLLNDQYTCAQLVKGSIGNQDLDTFVEPYWNGVLCVDCQASQYICNKECFRVWKDNSCSSTPCNTDQYTCESLCFLHWNYYQNDCFFDDVNYNSTCAISNDGVVVNGNCIQCHASQDLCENQCNQAYSPNGLRQWVNSKCTDCQKDATTCTTVCNMNWIPITAGAQTTYVCILCNSDSNNCSMCQGQWDSTTKTCSNISSFCNTNATNCSNCSFIPTMQFFYSTSPSKCYYCNLNQFTCEKACKSLWLPKLQFCEVLTTQDYCQLNNRGYWDSVSKSCSLCNSSSAACALCNSNNTWIASTGVCQNINLGKEYCPTSDQGGNFIWVTDTISSSYGISLQNGRCIPCDTSYNVCVNACKRSWDNTNSVCLTCGYSKAVCETNCLMNWVPQSAQKCALCNANQNTCVNICNWYWNSSTNSCLNCNSNLATCQNPSTCNGSWDATNSVCNFCNQSQTVCEQQCFFVYSQQTNSCINCQSSQQVCQQQCGYIWNPTLPVNTNCILCNQSKALCEATGTYNCNGFWLATNKCTQIKCNQDQNTCINKCIMVWNSIQNLCQACSQTQYQQTIATSPYYSCQPCNSLTLASDCSSKCLLNQFFWDTTITAATKCRQCTALEYWDGSKCILCSTIDPNCSKCQSVSGTATCLECANNFRVKTTSSCSCDSDRIPNGSGVCTLCSILIPNCSSCSTLTACGTCSQGYSWDSVNKVCRAKFTFTSNTLSGIAFLTDFTFTLSYPNANNPTNAPIVYAVYLYDSVAAYNSELSNFLNQQITVGVLYQKQLAQNTGYSVKLKTGNPVLAPLLILNGQVIPPEDQILIFTVTQQFSYLDQFTKYINQMSNLLTPQDFYYKQYADELVNQYYSNACSNCPTGVTCITNTKQCNCATSGTSTTLYDCSGLDNAQFNQLTTSLFSYFKSTNSQAQSQQKLTQLLLQVDTTGNTFMTTDLFQFYASLLPNYVSSKTTPTAFDYQSFIDIIKKVVTYTDYMVTNNLASKADQIYYPHDMIQNAIVAVLNSQTTYTLESLSNNRLSAAGLNSLADLVTTVDVYQLQYGQTKPLIYSQSSSLALGAPVKAARFFYNSDPFFIGNSTFTSYTNYPLTEYYVYQKSGSDYKRTNVNFTFIFTVSEIKQSTKCVQRDGNYLVLCPTQESDATNLKITCTCTNSATLIEKTILVEPIVTTSSSNNYLLYIILGCSLGGALVIFLGFLFVYLRKQAFNDKFKILKKQKDGSRALDPNLSLSDYDLEIKE